MRVFVYGKFVRYRAILVAGYPNNNVLLTAEQALRIPSEATFASRYSLHNSKFTVLTQGSISEPEFMLRYLGVHIADGKFIDDAEKAWFLLKYATNTNVTLDFPD